MKVLRAASLGSNFTGSYKKRVYKKKVDSCYIKSSVKTYQLVFYKQISIHVEAVLPSSHDIFFYEVSLNILLKSHFPKLFKTV